MDFLEADCEDGSSMALATERVRRLTFIFALLKHLVLLQHIY
jgi:hypothetical protein